MSFVIERSRRKAVLALVGCLAFVVVSVLLIATGSTAAVVVGVIGVVTFGVFGMSWIALGFRRGPGVVIEDQGFDDHSSAVSVGKVAWRDVIEVGEWSASRAPCVVVRVREPQVYLLRAPWYGRAATRANLRLVGSPVTLSSTSLQIDHHGLLSALQAGHARFLARRQDG